MLETVDEALEQQGESLRHYLQFDSYWTVGITKVEADPLFDLLQIRYLLGPPAKGITEFTPIHQDQELQVYSNPGSVGSKLFLDWKVSTESQALKALEGLDLEKTVVVEAKIPPPSAHSATATVTVKSLERQTQRSIYLVESDTPAVLVEFDRFSSGWKAFLNGKEQVEVFPAQSIFRGVFLPAGRNEVEFRYAPDSFRYGLAISAGGLLFFLLLLAANFPGRVRRSSPVDEI